MEETEIGASLVAEPWAFTPDTRHAALRPLAGLRGPARTGAEPAARISPLPEDDGDAPLQARRLQTLAFELTVAESRERQRIAHVLHDEVGQLLAMAQFRLSELRQDTPGGDTAGRAGAIEEIRTLLGQASRATRAATFELHSPVLQQLGLEAAVQGLAQRMRRMSSAMQVHLDADIAGLPLDEAVLPVLFRTVRELALNAQKHARAANLWITLDRDTQGLRIGVRDDGAGFDASDTAPRFSPEGGFGLFSAEAQVQAIGGRLVLESTPGHGTIATLTLALEPAVHPSPDPAPSRPPAHLS
jgi:signal transduction histidine kinase